MPTPDTSGLSWAAIRFIQEAWDRRTTIDSLARDHGVSKEVIRHIISLPRR
jgi:hypothetical protein